MKIPRKEGDSSLSGGSSKPPTPLTPDHLLPDHPDCKEHSHVIYLLAHKQPIFLPPNISELGGKSSHWIAGIIVHTRDLSRLMRENFPWSLDNLCPEFEKLERNISSDWCKSYKKKVSRRHYFLADRSEERWWSADLCVTARPFDIKILSRVKLSELSPEFIYGVDALNNEAQPVYVYDFFHPEQNINTIYDDRQLGAWWPTKQSAGAKTSRLLSFTWTAESDTFYIGITVGQAVLGFLVGVIATVLLLCCS